MDDGLYIYGEWVAEVDASLNKQANDLSSPATLQATYSNVFQIADTVDVRKLLQNAEQLDAGGLNPYRYVPARLIEEGEMVFNGVASLASFQGGWRITLAGPAKSLFEQLATMKLRDLELSLYDHPWTLDTISSMAGNTEGALYPLIDYGSYIDGAFAQDTLTPAMYAKTLIQVMLRQRGYKPAGDWLNDALIKRVIVPFVEDQPRAHDQEWVEDRYARVAVPDNPSPIELHNGSPINLLLPLTVDNLVLDGFQDGRLNRYDAARAVYVCDEPMRVKVTASVTFVSITRIGAAEIRLIVERNGVNVGEAYWSKAGFYDHLDYADVLTLEKLVPCRANDELRIRLKGNSKTQVSDYSFYFSQTIGEMWAAYEPDPIIYPGDTWKVAQNLPVDLSCADILKTIALMSSATFDIDEVKKTVELKRLDDVINAVADATDLSHCVEESDEPELIPIVEPYAQRNLLTWKEHETKALRGYGDGVIPCGAQNIPLETTLFELPFAAATDSNNHISQFGNPPYIETRTFTGSGDTLKVNRKSALPRLLLAEPSKPVVVIVNAETPELTVRPRPVQLTGCWWHARPMALQLSNNSFSLAFDRPDVNPSFEQTLIQRNFNAIRRILRRPRSFSVSVYLRPSELASLNLYVPIRLRRVRAGSLDINDNYFYLNKVENYKAGSACTLKLTAF